MARPVDPVPNGLAPRAPGEPRPVSPVRKVVQSSPAPAALRTRIGAENEPGMGVAVAARSLQARLGQDEGNWGPDQPCEQIGPVAIAPFSCSGAALDFLRVNVLPNAVKALSYYGITKFNRTKGTHIIPVDRTSNAPGIVAAQGAIVVPDGQAFIVTDFIGLTMEGVPGAPGVLRELDPAAVSLQVCFALIRQNGRQALSQQTLLGAEIFCNGTPFTRDTPGAGYPALTETSEVPLQPVYQVRILPFPGVPEYIGVRIRGYMVEQQLVAAALNRFSTVPDGATYFGNDD